MGTAKYGVTRFSDLTAVEFTKHYLGLDANQLGASLASLPQAEIPDIGIPKNFDWRNKNVVTTVKDQESCGSCWAFSTTGNIESIYAIKNKKLISLSEQELLDCDQLDGACHGGLMTKADQAIVSLGGLESEKAYPYQAVQGTCRLTKKKIVVTISGGVNITSNEKKMAQYLYKNGPISIGINADSMQLYQEGIAHPTSETCNPVRLNHGVLIVGYGKIDKTPYWIVKNSWGPTWGEEGYYRVYRGAGICGLDAMVSSALL